jgi:hypothetical protein
MAEFQTTVNNANVVRGNGLVEVANFIDGNPTWFNVGAVTELSVEEDAPIAREENDNADSTDRINKQEVKIAFTQLELLNLDVWEIMRSTLDTIQQGSTTTKIFSGNQTEIPFFMLRITTANGGEPFYFTAYRCNLVKGFTFQYQKDDGEDTRIKNPIEIIGKSDSTRNGFVWEIEGSFNG